MTQQFSLAGNLLTQAFGNLDRIGILRMNATNHRISIHFGERIRERPAGAFGGVSFSPTRARQSPSQFKVRPARRIHETDSPNQSTAALFFDRPDSIAAKVPVADVGGHRLPGFELGKRFAPDESHYFRI